MRANNVTAHRFARTVTQIPTESLCINRHIPKESYGARTIPGRADAHTRGVCRHTVATPTLLKELGARSLLDVGCGDINWMRNLEFLLATTFPAIASNVDLWPGSFRPINLELEPFNLPTPLRILHDSNDRSSVLALWRLAEIAP